MFGAGIELKWLAANNESARLAQRRLTYCRGETYTTFAIDID